MLQMSPSMQAHCYAIGRLAIIVIGTAGVIAACLAALWLVFQIAALILVSIVECCNLIGSLYSGADPLVKLLVLACVAVAMYRVVPRALRR